MLVDCGGSGRGCGVTGGGGGDGGGGGGGDRGCGGTAIDNPTMEPPFSKNIVARSRLHADMVVRSIGTSSAYTLSRIASSSERVNGMRLMGYLSNAPCHVAQPVVGGERMACCVPSGLLCAAHMHDREHHREKSTKMTDRPNPSVPRVEAVDVVPHYFPGLQKDEDAVPPAVKSFRNKIDLYSVVALVSPGVVQQTMSSRYTSAITTLKNAYERVVGAMGPPPWTSGIDLACEQLDSKCALQLRACYMLVRLMPPSMVSFVKWSGDRCGVRMIVTIEFLLEFLKRFVTTPCSTMIIKHHEEKRKKDAADRISALEQELDERNVRIREAEQRIACLQQEPSLEIAAKLAAAEARLNELEVAEVAAEDDMCLAQLRVVFRRVGARWHDREDVSRHVPCT